MIDLHPSEIQRIAHAIAPKFQQVLSEYSFSKYPADSYLDFRHAFAQHAPSEQQIAQSMIWKWGHVGKANFPQEHRRLIAEIQQAWPDFVASGHQRTPLATFDWWTQRLQRAYISVAFITHLIHHEAPLPIIDQHNFRAMNHLIAGIRPGWHIKKRPSQWADIMTLKAFMQALCQATPGLTFSDLDKFLMMYGRSHVPR
jgi:hypothetical protein